MTSMNIEILEAVSEKLEVRFGCNNENSGGSIVHPSAHTTT